MQIIRHLSHLPSHAQQGLLSIGKFDGLHLGHQALIRTLVAKARASDVPAIVMLFDPTPEAYFSANRVQVRLTRGADQFQHLRSLGVDRLLVLSFNFQWANFSAETFIDEVLVKTLHIQGLFVGADFRFGQGRSGTVAQLQAVKARGGFFTEVVEPMLDDGGVISASRARSALAQGDFQKANALLGRPYQVSGKVAHGRKLARTLGFKTLNLPLRHQLPFSGSYAVKVYGLGPSALLGSAYVHADIQSRGRPGLLEVHVLDFDCEVYGQRIAVEFCQKVGETQAWVDASVMRAKIAGDVARTIDYFRHEDALIYE